MLPDSPLAPRLARRAVADLLAALAKDWGATCSTSGAGKAVWFTLSV